jgi:hypothetical protein
MSGTARLARCICTSGPTTPVTRCSRLTALHVSNGCMSVAVHGTIIHDASMHAAQFISGQSTGEEIAHLSTSSLTCRQDACVSTGFPGLLPSQTPVYGSLMSCRRVSKAGRTTAVFLKSMSAHCMFIGTAYHSPGWQAPHSPASWHLGLGSLWRRALVAAVAAAAAWTGPGRTTTLQLAWAQRARRPRGEGRQQLCTAHNTAKNVMRQSSVSSRLPTLKMCFETNLCQSWSDVGMNPSSAAGISSGLLQARIFRQAVKLRRGTHLCAS